MSIGYKYALLSKIAQILTELPLNLIEVKLRIDQNNLSILKYRKMVWARFSLY